MIFNLLISKPKLIDLIPKEYVDIHSHILPGLDDGAKDIKESMELISGMEKLGFSKIITTPHTYYGLYENTNESILKSYKSLISHYNGNIEIKYSSEYMIDENLKKRIESKSLISLPKNHVLFEMSFISEAKDLHDIIFLMQISGYTPVLAHPERYRYLHNDYKKFFKLKKLGCKFQLNLLSVLGYYGNDILKISDRLLNDNLIDFVGSDIHSNNHIKYILDKKTGIVKVKNINQLEEVINNNKIFG